jgi:hypothetical protein
MIGHDEAAHCRELAAWLAGAGAEDDERVARILAERVATCPACAKAEAALVALVAGYGVAGEPPLAPDRERRLLDRLCGADQG